MKKLLSLVLAVTMALTMSACNGNKTDTTSEPDTPPFDCDLSQYVTLGQYKGVTYVPLKVDVTDDAVWERIMETLDYCGLYAEEVYTHLVETDLTEGEVLYGDLVEMDFSLTVEGEALEGCTAEAFASEIGGNFFTDKITKEDAQKAGLNYDFLTQFLTEIEKKTVGSSIGDTVSWTGTFPEDSFDNDLVGKDYSLSAKVTKVTKRYGHPDTLTDTEAAKLGEYETFEDLCDDVTDALEDGGYATTTGEIWHYICAIFKRMGYYDTTLYKEYYWEDLTEGTVEDGDVLEIAFEGFVDGERYEQACSDKYSLEIGSNSFISGFEEGLIGASVGDTVELNLTFPDPYPNNTSLSGKPVVFHVEVKSIAYRYGHPDVLSDVIMEQLYGYEMAPSTSFEDLWKQMYDEEKAEQESNVLTQKQADAWAAVEKNCTLIAYPQKEIDEYVSEYEKYYQEIAVSYYGYESLEAYLEMYGTTYEDFIEIGKEYAHDEIYDMMIMYSIARAEGFDKLEESEYRERAEKWVTYYNVDSYEALCEQAGVYVVKEWVMSDMVLELVTDNAVAVEG